MGTHHLTQQFDVRDVANLAIVSNSNIAKWQSHIMTSDFANRGSALCNISKKKIGNAPYASPVMVWPGHKIPTEINIISVGTL